MALPPLLPSAALMALMSYQSNRPDRLVVKFFVMKSSHLMIKGSNRNLENLLHTQFGGTIDVDIPRLLQT